MLKRYAPVSLSVRTGMDEDLRKRLLALPAALEPEIDTADPNQPFLLYSGEFIVEQNGRKETAEGELWFHWLPSPDVRFRGTVHDQRHLELDTVVIHVPQLGLTANALLSRIQLLESGWEASGSLNGGFRAGGQSSADVLEFELANFHSFIGEPIRYEYNGQIGLARRRIACSGSTWELILDEVADYSQRIRI